MKKTIHPQYFANATVTCSCGNSFVVGSTKPALATEICSNCHPFYTGVQNLVDTAGVVEKFQKRAKAADTLKAAKAEKKPRKTRGAAAV